jgi:hypothetical protein
VIAACILLFVNSLYTNAGFVRIFGKWDPSYQRLPQLVAAADLHNAVVFVPNTRNAPLGDYPFVPLDQADVVYFRTGPLPQWGLNLADWRVAYERYFSGRSAYVFDKAGLRQLDTTAEVK